MHKVEIRLGVTEGPARDFEVYVEKMKDGSYVEAAPVNRVATDVAAPMTMILEGDERVIIVAKERTRKVVYDRDQNANVIVFDEEDEKAKADREARQKHADEVTKKAAAEGATPTTSTSTGFTPPGTAPRPTDTGTSAEKPPVISDAAKNAPQNTSQQPSAPAPTPKAPATSPAQPAQPARTASETQSARDSKQVKADNNGPGTVKP